jgi:AcrR family transcriptional regulator
MGRPKSEAAASHGEILDAVLELLQDTPVRDLTMEAVAKRARVGKPTLYKWWPSKGALVLALFHERMAQPPALPHLDGAENSIRARVRLVVREFNGLYGRLMAELIAEGQAEPALLQDLYDRHIGFRRTYVIAEIERAKESGELLPHTNAEVLVDEIFGAIYYRLLLRIRPFDEAWGDQVVNQAFGGLRADKRS